MDKIQIKANQMIAEAIEKLIEKTRKKAEKERAKINTASVTYKGEVFKSENEIMDAYACDFFTEAVYDRLIKKLEEARGKMDPHCMTDSEMLVLELENHKADLLHAVAWDKEMKRRQEEKDKRMLELTSKGYSIREAETMISNEELMRFE